MAGNTQTLREWLLGEIEVILERQSAAQPYLLWCDPKQEWLGLLSDVASVGGFELWANPQEHELLLRDHFHHTPRVPRVIWVSRARAEITWFEVYALEAEMIWEKSLLQALREYGVLIPRDLEGELVPLLSAHAREWLDEPRETWKELTPVTAKGTLVDDHRLLQALAGEAGEFSRLREEGRFSIFARRAVEDFGLPDPTGQEEAAWRVAATASLLCTEAATANPDQPPSEGKLIIPPGLVRDRALKLLKDWQSNIHFLASFERLVPKADGTTGLTYWTRNLKIPPRSYSSRAVEEALFDKFVKQLDPIEEVDLLAREMESLLPAFMERNKGFWGELATNKIRWSYLVDLAEAASLLTENAEPEKAWRSVGDAIQWYCNRGWQLDLAGESLFEERPDLPGQLHRIRARLRRGYLRATDRIGCAFSQLLDKDARAPFALPTAGEVALAELEASTVPTALIFLDAFRLDLGQRLAELLNSGEPAQRAEVLAAVAPIPARTELGMAFALPLKRNQLRVALPPDGKNFHVQAVGFAGDLSLAEQRRQWLAQQWGVKRFLSVDEVLDGETLKRLRKPPRLIVVHGREFDTAGHEGQLQLTGAADHLERYAKAIRHLREAGFSRVIAVTDHGFFHWQPDADEIEEAKPKGELLWASRRAMVGRGLSHPTAVRMPVMQSELEAMVPRSVNAFKTYGGLGFFHGGAMLQEMIIPVVVVRWPVKATKVSAVLKPVVQITSEMPRVEVEAGREGLTLFGPDEKQLARQVIVEVQNPATGKLVFKHNEPVTIEPGGEAIIVQLRTVEPKPTLERGTMLVAEVRDADDREILIREEISLEIDIDEW